MSPLVLAEILGMFANTLTADAKYPIEDWELATPNFTADGKYPVPDAENLQLAIQMQFSE